MRFAFALTLVALPIAAATARGETVTFEMIPFALGANDMSPDGRFVVGDADWDGDGLVDGSYLWDSVDNIVTDLENLLDPSTGSPVSAVSDDGQVVLGTIPNPEDPNLNLVFGTVAGIWRASTGEWESLGYLPNAGECPSRSNGHELSADGSVAVGLSWDGCSGRAFRWTQAGGMVEMQNLANGANRASVVSADGSLLGGFAQGTQSRTPAIWDANGNGTLLDPTAFALGEIQGMREDGQILLGTWLTTEPVTRATKWTASPGGWTREQIANGSFRPGWAGIPMDIADSGTIVGFDFLVGSRRAWIQPGGVGPLQELQPYIEAHGGSVPEEIVLEVCQAISNDGRIIIGHGFGTGAWRVIITPDFCPGDATGDGLIDLDDLLLVLGDFGNPGPDANGDTDGDGDTDLDDLLLVLGSFDTNCTS